MHEAYKNSLPEGFILNSRYQVISCLNIGTFVNIYDTFDLERKEICTIRELFPLNAIRDQNHYVSYPQLSPEEIFRLQHIFIEDAKQYSTIVVPEFFLTRDIFNENHTRYHVINSLDNKTNLEDMWSELPTLPLNIRLNISQMFFKALKLFNEYQFTHFQLTPKNIYLDNHFFQISIMPGARAQLWYTDKTGKPSQILDSLFTHPDCLEKDQMRGFHCDIYSIWKIFLHLFPEKYLGNKIPKNIQELYQIFNPSNLEKEKILLNSPIAKKFECPACNKLLEAIKPLPKDRCPICREGFLKYRTFALNACAQCKVGVLQLRSNISRLQHCPICQTGKLSYKNSFNKKIHVLLCLSCREGFLEENNQITRLLNRIQKPLSQWMKEANRSEVTHVCDHCDTQFDELKDGQWKKISFSKNNCQKYLPEEWARLAANMNEGAGNTSCDCCHGNFDLIQDNITPLSSPYCTSLFFNFHKFQLLDSNKIKWLGMDKRNPFAGLICKNCRTEFDDMGKNQWKLIWTGHDLLQNHINKTHPLEEWHNLNY